MQELVQRFYAAEEPVLELSEAEFNSLTPTEYLGIRYKRFADDPYGVIIVAWTPWHGNKPILAKMFTGEGAMLESYFCILEQVHRAKRQRDESAKDLPSVQ